MRVALMGPVCSRGTAWIIMACAPSVPRILSGRTVIARSTNTSDGALSPFCGVGAIRSRNGGVALVTVDVTDRTVTDVWLANRSDWMTTPGRDFRNALGRTTCTTLPRFKSSLRGLRRRLRRPRRSRAFQVLHGPQRPRGQPAVRIPRRIPSTVYQGPRSAPAAGLVPSAPRGASAPVRSRLAAPGRRKRHLTAGPASHAHERKCSRRRRTSSLRSDPGAPRSRSAGRVDERAAERAKAPVDWSSPALAET